MKVSEQLCRNMLTQVINNVITGVTLAKTFIGFQQKQQHL